MGGLLGAVHLGAFTTLPLDRTPSTSSRRGVLGGVRLRVCLGEEWGSARCG